MRILYIATVFPEDSYSFMLPDLTKALVELNHHVTMLTTEECAGLIPSFPLVNGDGVEIHTLKTDSLNQGNLFCRALKTFYLNKKLNKVIKKLLAHKSYDLVFCEASPPAANGTLIHLQKQCMTHLFVFVKEIFPQIACGLRIPPENSLLYKYLAKKQKKLFFAADTLAFTSEGTKQYVSSLYKELDHDKLEVFPFRKSLTRTETKEIKKTWRKKLGISSEVVLFFFGGNIGKRQDAVFICSALEKMKNHEELCFVFTDTGGKINYVKDRLAFCKNVKITGTLTRQEYERLAEESDVGVLTLDYHFTIPYYPECAVTFMEKSLPILAATDSHTDFRNLIKNEQCGLWCASNDIFSFCNLINKLTEDAGLRRKLGNNARRYAEKNLNIQQAAALLEQKAEDSAKGL